MGNTRSRTNTPLRRRLRMPPASPRIRVRRNLGPQFDNVYLPPPSPISKVEDSDNEDWNLGLDLPSPISKVEDSDNEDWNLGLDLPSPPSPISKVEDSDNEDWDLGLDRLRRPASRVVRARRTLRAALDEAWENDRTERARRRLEELEELTRMMRMLNLGRKRKRSW